MIEEKYERGEVDQMISAFLKLGVASLLVAFKVTCHSLDLNLMSYGSQGRNTEENFG